MKNRLSLTVGILFWGVSLTKAGMTWEEWTPENGIIDGQAALQEILEAGKMSDENWQEKALAFINAFEKLKLQLQFFWRSQVGDGGVLKNPWNGVPDGCEPDGKKGFVRKDCPIVLRFWMDGHIGKYCIPEGYCVVSKNSNTPNGTMVTEKEYSKKKGNLKKYIFAIFKNKDLKLCALFLNQNFCRLVSRLVNVVIDALKMQSILQKQDLETLFRLYAAYDNLDLANSQEGYNNTTDNICTFVSNCCYNNLNQLDKNCKVWFVNLFINYKQNPYGTEAGLGQYNLHLTKILELFTSKMKINPQKLDAMWANVMKVVTEEWQQWLSKYEREQEENKKLTDWYLAMWALEDALY